MWIDVFHDLYQVHKEFDVENFVAAALYLHPQRTKIN